MHAYSPKTNGLEEQCLRAKGPPTHVIAQRSLPARQWSCQSHDIRGARRHKCNPPRGRACHGPTNFMACISTRASASNGQRGRKQLPLRGWQPRGGERAPASQSKSLSVSIRGAPCVRLITLRCTSAIAMALTSPLRTSCGSKDMRGGRSQRDACPTSLRQLANARATAKHDDNDLIVERAILTVGTSDTCRGRESRRTSPFSLRVVDGFAGDLHPQGEKSVRTQRCGGAVRRELRLGRAWEA